MVGSIKNQCAHKFTEWDISIIYNLIWYLKRQICKFCLGPQPNSRDQVLCGLSRKKKLLNTRERECDSVCVLCVLYLNESVYFYSVNTNLIWRHTQRRRQSKCSERTTRSTAQFVHGANEQQANRCVCVCVTNSETHLSIWLIIACLPHWDQHNKAAAAAHRRWK